MPLRPLNLPADLEILGELLPVTFQYPENEAWSVQADEKESLVESVGNLKRMWPLVAAVQLFSPTLRDIMRGYVWEEDDEAVGVVLTQRRGGTDTWVVTTVGVHPDYRRRGIARKLVEAGLELIRQHGGRVAWLDVIAGNLPAYRLYESLGFEHYSGSSDLNYVLDVVLPAVGPQGYTLAPLPFSDWRVRYDLEKAISPPAILKYEPVEEKRFRRPALMRLLVPILNFATGQNSQVLVVKVGEEIVGVARYDYRVRAGGVNTLIVRLRPNHPEIAKGLLEYLVAKVQQLSPGRRLEIDVPQWQEEVLEAALAVGFKPRVEYHRMGIVL